MDHFVSGAEADRGFFVPLREVRASRIVGVTGHGKPVARIVPSGTANVTREVL